MTQPRAFVDALVSEGVTHLVAVPSLLRAMIPAMTASVGQLLVLHLCSSIGAEGCCAIVRALHLSVAAI